jgi:hypothetical protein
LERRLVQFRQYSLHSTAPGCNDRDADFLALKGALNKHLGHIDNSVVDMLEIGEVEPIGVNNIDGSKKCRIIWKCNLNKAKQIEANLIGSHPLTKACYEINKSWDAGDPTSGGFTIRPNGEGGYIVHVDN